MNEIQIIGITNYFVITGIVLSGIWAGAYILSWIVQWAWAWVDETSVSKANWIVNLTNPRKELNGWYKNTKYKGNERRSWQFFKFDNGICINHTDTSLNYEGNTVGEMDFGVGMSPNTYTYHIYILVIWFGVLCAEFWYISMWFAMAVALAHITRMGRRGQKLLTAHIADKKAHK